MTSTLVLTTAAAVGAVVASYVTTAAMRATSDVEVREPRSRCDGCHRRLGWGESLPLVSFAVLRGRCRSCASPISRLHPGGEAAGLAAGLAIAVIAPDYRAIPLAIIAATLLAASVIDLRIRQLPDLMIAMIALAGMSLAALHGLDAWITGVVTALCLYGLFAGVSMAYRRLRGKVGLGMGDVKLIAALACWLGLATPWVMVAAMSLAIVRVVIARPVDGKVTTGPLLAASGFTIGLLLEAGLWPRL